MHGGRRAKNPSLFQHDTGIPMISALTVVPRLEGRSEIAVLGRSREGRTH
ncbi:hypothetical protein F383_36153 [Gossypium arboreum]|uniref:Uncharacterized protein n=1 Tax=Gossypium arboreum TaxID=29729 RepID=A0A0B0PZ15_GOSAR|nr:hypothetical protein F383_36153 [Gossypium arboreum]